LSRNNKKRFGRIAEEDSEVSSDPESEKGVRIQLKKQEVVKEEKKLEPEAGTLKSGKIALSKLEEAKGDIEYSPLKDTDQEKDFNEIIENK